MKPKLKSKWINALASGKYQQADGYLYQRNEDGKETYCCLGVLCIVAGKHIDGARADEVVESGMELLNSATLEQFGLTNDQQQVLSAMNDGTSCNGIKYQKHTFHEIAQYIENWL